MAKTDFATLWKHQGSGCCRLTKQHREPGGLSCKSKTAPWRPWSAFTSRGMRACNMPNCLCFSVLPCSISSKAVMLSLQSGNISYNPAGCQIPVCLAKIVEWSCSFCTPIGWPSQLTCSAGYNDQNAVIMPNLYCSPHYSFTGQACWTSLAWLQGGLVALKGPSIGPGVRQAYPSRETGMT